MKKYVVKPGRTRALGKKVKPGAVIGPISDTEAEYDLNQGNIAPAPAETAGEKAEPKARRERD